jgi:hypothetical protein
MMTNISQIYLESIWMTWSSVSGTLVLLNVMWTFFYNQWARHLTVLDIEFSIFGEELTKTKEQLPRGFDFFQNCL